MKRLLILWSLLPVAGAAAQQHSFIPADNVPAYVFERLDLTTFRNSTGPLRKDGQRHFAELGYSITAATADTLLIEDEFWRYTIKVLQRRDITGDGYEDLEICFTDQAKTGTYNTQAPLLLTQFSADGNLLALKFETFGCDEYAR